MRRKKCNEDNCCPNFNGECCSAVPCEEEWKKKGGQVDNLEGIKFREHKPTCFLVRAQKGELFYIGTPTCNCGAADYNQGVIDTLTKREKKK